MNERDSETGPSGWVPNHTPPRHVESVEVYQFTYSTSMRILANYHTKTHTHSTHVWSYQKLIILQPSSKHIETVHIVSKLIKHLGLLAAANKQLASQC